MKISQRLQEHRMTTTSTSNEQEISLAPNAGREQPEDSFRPTLGNRNSLDRFEKLGRNLLVLNVTRRSNMVIFLVVLNNANPRVLSDLSARQCQDLLNLLMPAAFRVKRWRLDLSHLVQTYHHYARTWKRILLWTRQVCFVFIINFLKRCEVTREVAHRVVEFLTWHSCWNTHYYGAAASFVYYT